MANKGGFCIVLTFSGQVVTPEDGTWTEKGAKEILKVLREDDPDSYKGAIIMPYPTKLDESREAWEELSKKREAKG